MKVQDTEFYKMLLDNVESILIYNISYKMFMGAKPMCIRFDKIYGFIKIYDAVRYSVLFGPER